MLAFEKLVIFILLFFDFVLTYNQILRPKICVKKIKLNLMFVA